MKESKPHFHKQEKPYSCVPACLRMVLGALGQDISEPALRQLCDSGPLGTQALKAVDCVRVLGFTNSGKYTLTAGELSDLVRNGQYPIVYVSLAPIDGVRGTHALVLLDIDQVAVTVLDPLQGERTISLPAFNAGWAMRHNLAILVRS